MLTISKDQYYELTQAAEYQLGVELYVSTFGGCCCADYEIEDKDLAARAAVDVVLEKLGIKVSE